ncbi:hypothetical protein [Limnothrix redekei]|uniref:FHA domain-containing protein n=1 Tax=Limnothrix redekei LRLZ20PSL1 TaxID=3112953 RepID=A0ABW7CCD6_9CYAN
MAWGCVVLVWGCLLLPIGGCAKEPPPLATATPPKPNQGKVVGAIDEVAPPSIVQRLNRELDRYQPQVQIIAPRPDETLTQTQVAVQLRVQDLPLFKDEALAAGPHLKLMLDDRPVAEIFDVTDPITISDLTPGTHTLRAFAERPWHESFKNDGAYAQVSFHVFAKTQTQVPDSGRPLLTYNQPIGTVGTEPVLLDFYLTNAPLHLLARERDDDEIVDWKVRVTVNGDSFLLDDWQSIYLKGFRRGKNWVKLELINDRGELLENAFNESVALVEFDPNQTSAIDRLLKGGLSESEARALIDPTYEPPAPKPVAAPEPIAPLPQDLPAVTEAPKTEAPKTEAPEAIAPATTPAAPSMEAVNPEPEDATDENVTDNDTIAPGETLAPQPSAVTPAESAAPAPEPAPEPKTVIPETVEESAIINPPAAPEPEPVLEPSAEPVSPESASPEPLDAALPQAETRRVNSLLSEDREESASPALVSEPKPETAPPSVIAPAAATKPKASATAVPTTEPIDPEAQPKPAAVVTPKSAPPVAVKPPIALESIEPVTPEPIVEPTPSDTPSATATPDRPLKGLRKQFLKWLKQTQQQLPDDLNLPFDIKQVPIPSGD